MTGVTQPSSALNGFEFARSVSGAFRPSAPNDRVVGAIRARDVERIHLRMIRRVRAYLRAAVNDREPARVHERSERLREDGAERLVDRVHLEEDDLVFDEEPVECIHRGDRRHVSAAEDEAHAAFFAARAAVNRALGRGLAARDPDVRADAHEHEPLERRRRKHARDGSAVGSDVRVAAGFGLPPARSAFASKRALRMVGMTPASHSSPAMLSVAATPLMRAPTRTHRSATAAVRATHASRSRMRSSRETASHALERAARSAIAESIWLGEVAGMGAGGSRNAVRGDPPRLGRASLRSRS